MGHRPRRFDARLLLSRLVLPVLPVASGGTDVAVPLVHCRLLYGALLQAEHHHSGTSAHRVRPGTWAPPAPSFMGMAAALRAVRPADRRIPAAPVRRVRPGRA